MKLNKIYPTVYKILNEEYVNNSKDIINSYTHYKSGENYYPNSEYAKWFLSQDRKSKEQIAYRIKNDENLKNALLSNWYDYYKNNNADDISYEDFLNNEITLYRGETSRDIKYGEADGFSSYTTQKDLAKHFSADGNGKIIELNIKPKDTYGMFNTVGNEVEILIPTKFSNDFIKNKLDEYINKNMWIFDKLNDNESDIFDDLYSNENYEKAMELISNYISKYKNKYLLWN